MIRTEKPGFTQTVAAYAVLGFSAILPWKLASLAVSTAASGGFYPGEWALYWFTDWPVATLGVWCGILLFLSIAAGGLMTRNGFFAVSGAALLALVGLTTPGRNESYALSLFAYLGAVAAYLASVLNCNEFYPGFRRKFLGAWTVGTGLVLLSGIHQYFWGFDAMAAMATQMNLSDTHLMPKIAERRIFASFTLCNALGAFLVLSLPIAVSGIADWAGRKSTRMAAWVAAGIFGAVGAFVLWGTGNRASVLALAAGGAAYLMISKLKLRWKFAALFLMLLTVAAVWGAAYLSGRSFGTVESRLDYARTTLVMLEINPVCGAGWGSFKHLHAQTKTLPDTEFAEDPHNVLLAFLGEGGVVSFWVFFILFAGALAVAVRRAKNPDASGLDQAVLIGVVAASVHLLLDMGWLFAPVLGGTLVWALLDENPEKPAKTPYVRIAFGALFALAVLALGIWETALDRQRAQTEIPVERRVK